MSDVPQPPRAARIDWEGVALAGGFGVAAILIGCLVLWAVLDPGPGTSGRARLPAATVSQQAIRLLPDSIKASLAAIFAGIMLLGGIASCACALYFMVRPRVSEPASIQKQRVSSWKPRR